MADSHPGEAASGLLWDIPPQKNEHDNDGLSQDERDLMEYVREHPE